MVRSIAWVCVLGLLALALPACAQGPGHTRAAAAAIGTGAGALIGAAASPCCPGGGALVGGALGLVTGAIVGEGIAQDQERECPPPCVVRRRCSGCEPVVVPRRTVIRRKVYIVENGVQRPAEEVVEEVIEETPASSYGYGGD